MFFSVRVEIAIQVLLLACILTGCCKTVEQAFLQKDSAVRTPLEPIYLTFFCHNEADEPYWQGLRHNWQQYNAYRTGLVAKVRLLKQYGAVLNWQADHTVLEAMHAYERGDLLKTTNNKHILVWMVEDMGMRVDPHGHLTEYNYADLAYLIEQMGVTPSTVLGGFALYECAATGKTLRQINWKKLLEINDDGTIRGRRFPHYVWSPKLLEQPAMIGHGYDECSSGVWHPAEDVDFGAHQLQGRFTCVGTGYPFQSRSFKAVHDAPAMLYGNKDYILELLDKIESGKAPAGLIYTASIHFPDISSPESIANLKEMLVFLDPFVKSGRIIYQDYESVFKIWKEKYQGQPNRFGIENFRLHEALMRELEDFCSRIELGG